jgi:hypothetical protein
MHIIPHNLLSYEHMWAHSCCLTPSHRSRTGTTGWGAWRMLWRVRERSRPSSRSQLWVAGLLSPYNVIIYLFCTELLLCSKDVTFDLVSWFIICVRLGPAHLVIMFTPGSWCPETRVWHIKTKNRTPKQKKSEPKSKKFEDQTVVLFGYHSSKPEISLAFVF